MTQIIPGLWQGGNDDLLDADGFDLVVAAAVENDRVPGAAHVPLDDVEWTVSEEARAARLVDAAALEVAKRVVDGQQVLVVCWMGLNRSGLIVARALMLLGLEAPQAIALVRKRRSPMALSNQSFVDWLYEQEK
jgi:protein-tyrosine phosphatase